MASYDTVDNDILRELIWLCVPIEIDGNAFPPCRMVVSSFRHCLSLDAQS